jgi:hypothetical protein
MPQVFCKALPFLALPESAMTFFVDQLWHISESNFFFLLSDLTEVLISHFVEVSYTSQN